MPPIRIEASHFSLDIRTFIELLHSHEARYLIVGGEAVIFHGHVRLTGDVDFFFARDTENRGRLHAAVHEFWDGDVPGGLTAGDFEPEGTIVQFGLPPNRIDLINSIAGVDFDDVWPGRVEAVLVADDREIPLPYIGLAALIENKRATGRPQDLTDLGFLTKKL